MNDAKRYFLTTAIDYPNSRPHIGTAFEKIGADVQARYRRMEGYDVFFLMGNDENTVKVAKRAAELNQQPKPYCDDMARQFKEVWQTLEISFDDFIQTSEPRHHEGCRNFIQKVYDNGYIYLGDYEGWYCEGCEAFKTDTEVKEANGLCPIHQKPVLRRIEPCYYFALSKFQQQLLTFYAENPDFIQPDSRRNEVVTLVQTELKDVNISRYKESWGIRIPFAEDYTIYVWFDALLNYITAIGYGADEERFNKWWPADLHVIGKDITRFHCALWPAMCFAAGIAPPKRVFGHGFVYIKGEKISKSLGNAIEPMDIVTRFSADAFRYYFLRECPFPGDGEFSWERFTDSYNAGLANNLGNLYSRVATLITTKYGNTLEETVGQMPAPVARDEDLPAIVKQIQTHIEACQYNQAMELIWLKVLNPANLYLEENKPWTVVKTDMAAAKTVLFAGAERLRIVSILLKPFLPRTAETIYRSFNFPQPWDTVRYEDAGQPSQQREDLRFLADLENGKPKPLFPRVKV